MVVNDLERKIRTGEWMKLRVIGVIPPIWAKRFPGSPGLDRGRADDREGHPQVKKANRLTDVWVATDDKRIAETAKGGRQGGHDPSNSLGDGSDRLRVAL